MGGYTERHRNYCFTSFKCDRFLNGDSKFKDWSKNGIKYIVYQVEKCASTGKEHIQGYFEGKRMSYKAVRECFGDDSIHLELRRGSQAEAIAYCKKEDTRISGPFEFGVKNNQGARNDLRSIYEDIVNDSSLEDITERYAGQMIRYGRGIKDLYYNHLNSTIPNFKEVQCTILYGDAGTGKTKYIYDKFDPAEVYRLRRSNNGTLWFDGYTGQKVLLIDEFYGWITWSDLLEFTDGYKLKLDVKGGFTFKNWDYVFITSNKAPENWYNDFNCMDKKEFRRRIYEIIELKHTDISIGTREPIRKVVDVIRQNGRLEWKERKSYMEKFVEDLKERFEEDFEDI